MIKQSTCQNCGEEFDYVPLTFEGKVLFTPNNCDACTEIAILKGEQEVYRRREDARKLRFGQMVPPIYLETDKTRLQADLLRIVDSWEYNPTGIGFVGTSGKGKTRAAVLLLDRLDREKKLTFFLSATDLALNSANQFADNHTTRLVATSILTLCRTSQVLLLDDLGKGRMTDRAESELYDLLEYRTSHRVPTIWTSNSDARGLHAMFSRDRGDAIIRRLAEFSTVVKV